ncbi:hypothetical protein T4E_5292 [Trichinella pseudospiralis]|uniref:Uncharacterized protein n=1 Tax=Trichinella pseudospiralis TaxID=6337 RepID=A0A0V0YNQ7_TRIPS|nr:hypothetical protein T4E_5292 [Trichinella pseudospiralis]
MLLCTCKCFPKGTRRFLASSQSLGSSLFFNSTTSICKSNSALSVATKSGKATNRNATKIFSESLKRSENSFNKTSMTPEKELVEVGLFFEFHCFFPGKNTMFLAVTANECQSGKNCPQHSILWHVESPGIANNEEH